MDSIRRLEGQVTPTRRPAGRPLGFTIRHSGETEMGHGIDYGHGKVNIDRDTGIRFGVIPANDIVEAWGSCSEPDYGDPTCPKCGEVANDISGMVKNYEKMQGWEDSGSGYYCNGCKHTFDSDVAYGCIHGWDYTDGGYVARQESDGDIFIMKSPYYTLAVFCAPCAPGACHLRNPVGDGSKAYCFGQDWFSGDAAPYPVFRVEDNSYVNPGSKQYDSDE